MLMKWKSLFAAALSAAVALPALAQSSTGGGGTPAEGGGLQQAPGTAPGRVISVNVIGGNNPNGTWTALTSIKDTEGHSGLADYRVDNANWNELTQQNSGNSGGTPETLEAPVDNTGAPTFATVTARLGGWWHLQKTEASKAARMNAVGHMGVGFCDPSKVADTNELTLANVPYTEYSLILYYGTNNEGHKWAAPKVTFADGTYKNYTYAADATGAATEGTDAWGSTTAATTSGQAGTLGKDVMLIEGLSGNISIDLGTQPDAGEATQAGSLCGFQIVCTGEVIPVDPTKEGVISLNFGSNHRTVPENETAYGLVPVAGNKWQNFSGASGTEDSVMTAENVDLTSTPMTVTYSASGMWKNEEATDPFMYGYLDDGDAISGVSDNVAVSVDVAGVGEAFDVYDVIVYLSTDEDFYTFFPVQVNGSYYRWDDTFKTTVKTTVATPDTSEAAAFGQGKQAATKYGVNAIRVTAQTGPLALRTLPRLWDGNVGRSQRGCLAAIQVVERKVIEVNTADFDLAGALTAYAEGTPLLVKVASGATIAGDVTLPADAILDLSAYTFGDTLPINGTLTMNGGTIRLPAGFDSAKIAASISGSFKCLLGDEPVWLSNQDGTLSLSYEWWGLGGDDLWSNPLNWSSGRVPNKNAEVSFNLGASDEIVILDKAATVASVTITGPKSGAATLALTSAEGGSLTVSGQMLTTGNVTVTQSADITVNGASELYQPYPDMMPDTWMPELASFQVHQATYKVTAGTLAIPNGDGDLGVSGHGTVEVSGTGAIVANRARGIYYEQNNSNAQGTFRVAESGVLALATTASFAQRTPLETLGGTLRATAPNVRLSLFAGLALETAPVTVEAVEGATLTLAYTGSNGALLSGSENLTLKGPGSINFNGTVAEDYSGTVTIAEGTPATLGLARPPLAVESGAKVTVTAIAPEETGIGEIAFPTEMEKIPDNVTFVVNGLKDGIEFRSAIESNQLVLKWAVEIPAMTTSGAWGEATKWDTQKVPTSGVARLDGGESGIEVTLDTELSGMESIIVSGVVSLKTTETQSRIPASITLEKGATLTIDAPFSGVGLGAQWELPVGTTLRVDDADFTGWYALNMQGLVEFLPSGSAESPIQMDTDTAQFHGGLTIAGNYVQLSKIVELGGTVTLAGNNISLTGPVEESATGKVFHCTTNTRIVNVGNDNRIYNLGGCTGTFLVNAGTLSLEVVRAPIAGLVGLVVAKDATLTFEEACVGGQYPLSGEGTVVIAGTLRPQVKAFELDGVTYNTIPAKMVFVATEEEQTNGVIQFLNAGNATVPANFVAEVTTFGDADVWVPVATNGNPIRIRNVPAPNGVAGLEEAVALAIRRAAAEAGFTDGDYTVQLTTKGQPVEVTADMLNDVLGCFTGLKATANAEGTTLTYAYDFGIVGVKRDTNGWVVTAKVQGANAEAGFAADNVYTLTVNGTEVSVEGATVGEGGTVTLPLADTEVQGDAVTLGVKVSRRPAQTPAQ